MPLPLNSTASAESPLQTTESRMREALGLRDRPLSNLPQQRPEQARQRHRFVRDGEVPTVVLGSRKEQDSGPSPDHRIAVMQAALDSERAARALAERALQEAQMTIQNLQTRLAHAEMAHSDALAAEHAGREQAERDLGQAVASRDTAERQIREMAAPSSPDVPKRAPKKIAPTASAGTLAPAPKPREPQPVKWWLPSYRAKAHKR